MKRLFLVLYIILIVNILSAQTRLKDISKVSGADSKQLIGYGLVVGLQGTGDSPASVATIQSLYNMFEHFNLSVQENRIRPNNVAIVTVTANMPPFASNGSTFDVVVSSVGDARSLEGGTLLRTTLVAPDNRVYAIAQGPLSMGGFREENRQTRLRQSYSNTGRVPNGAIVSLENSNNISNDGELKFLLHSPDFTTAERVAAAINAAQGMRLATANNASTISVIIPDEVFVNDSLIAFVSNLENLMVVPQQSARVVINERTGTIVAGGNVQISSVAIAHGNLMLRIATDTTEYTTGPFTLVVSATSNIESSEQTSRMFTLESATVQELAAALNAIRCSPRDMISIFQSLKEAGALQAELRII
jgi:flagellar P-ring protein precursor FlgI